MSEPRTRRWKRVEYERLIEVGFFQPEDRVELLDGQMIVAEPQPPRHYTAIQCVAEALRAAFGAGWSVRTQGPLALDDESEPEPDVAVVRGSFRRYADAHPSDPVLVVEIAEASLGLDREYKGSLYARAGIADYWILNVVDGILEVHREPAADETAPVGWRYRAVEVHTREAFVAPLARPDGPVRVADLLP